MSVISALGAAEAREPLTRPAAPPHERAHTLALVTACRPTADNAASPGCYDAAVKALDSAERPGEVMVMNGFQNRPGLRLRGQPS